MYKIIYSLSILLFPILLSAQTVKSVEMVPNNTVQVEGNLSEGEVISDLSFAWNSSVACFPATQSQKFTGTHVFYESVIPKYSELEVTVIPDDPQANFSIYAYEVGVGNESLPPNLPRCIRCEVDHKWDRPWKGKVQDHTRTAKNLVAINRPYKVVVAVVGADGLNEGAYKLQFKLKSR